MADDEGTSDGQSPFEGYEQEPIRGRGGRRIAMRYGTLAAAMLALTIGVGGLTTLGGDDGGGDASPIEDTGSSETETDPGEAEPPQECLADLPPFRSVGECVRFASELEAAVLRLCRSRGDLDCRRVSETAVETYFFCRSRGDTHRFCTSIAVRESN